MNDKQVTARPPLGEIHEISARDESRREIVRIRDATEAAEGLLALQDQLLEETGTGEMPEWWNEFYQGAVNLALRACVEKTAAAIDGLDKR